jgi:hypothetical protein
MILSFEITMPNVGSWNGKWSGSQNAHFSFETVTKKEGERLMQGKKERNFYYNFGDGWGANVKMRPVTAAEKKIIEKSNKGFMGYDWMIDSIIKNDKIIC